jgi:hypothetical protein
MATDRELLAARLFFKAVFPIIKVILQDDPKMNRKFQNVKAEIQFTAKDEKGPVGAWLIFNNGEFSVDYGICQNPDITFSFKSVKKMNDMLAGKPVIPSIKGITKFSLLVKILSLLLSLKILMPNARPKDKMKKKLKVKLSFYMITTALSQYNKGGDPDMVKWTTKQPDRIYQISVDGEDIAAYLRVKAGNSKAGRGFYTRKRPFLHMKFHGVDGALAVLLRDAEFVDAVSRGYVSVEGAPEYAAQLNDFMQRIQAMLT